MSVQFKTLDDVKAYISNIDLAGKTGRDALRHIGRETVEALCAVRGGNSALSEKIGNTNPGVLSRDRGDLGWREVSTRTGNGNGEAAGNNGEKTAVKPRLKVKGFIPPVTMAWAQRQLDAAWVAQGNDLEDAPDVELNPDVFAGIPAFAQCREGWQKHVEKMGGIDSEPMKAFRAWLGKPLTPAQAEAEAEADVKARRTVKLSSLKSCLDAAAKLADELMLLDVSNGIAETLARLDAVV